MHYKWESVGDQDYLVRKICYLGPYLLEHVEERWTGDQNNPAMIMASRVYIWNDADKIPDLIAELPEVEYERDVSCKCLEDWYAINVLAEELFTGDINGDNKD